MRVWSPDLCTLAATLLSALSLFPSLSFSFLSHLIGGLRLQALRTLHQTPLRGKGLRRTRRRRRRRAAVILWRRRVRHSCRFQGVRFRLPQRCLLLLHRLCWTLLGFGSEWLRKWFIVQE